MKQLFNSRLKIIREVGFSDYGKRMALYACVCGNEKVIAKTMVDRGVTKSCGCLQKEVAASNGRNSPRVKPKGVSALNCVFFAYARVAKRRGIAFKLNVDEFSALVCKPCHYCGKSPSNVFDRPTLNGGCVYSGIDRVDNQGSYTWDNCVPCCKTCNTAKGTMSEAEFFSWISAVHAQVCQIKASVNQRGKKSGCLSNNDLKSESKT